VTSSLLPTVVDALVSILDTALAIPVYDGGLKQTVDPAALTIGATVDAGEFEWHQEWTTLAAATRPREETFDVPGALWATSGDPAFKPLRDQIYGYWATVEATLRANPTFGISTNSLRTLLAPSKYMQSRSPKGVVCRIDFTIRVKARI
jgi:hypothetical protein